MLVEFIALSLALAAIGLVLGYTLATGAPPTPTGPRVRSALLAVLPESPPGPVLELGAGWGGLALALARRYPGHRVRAVEISPLPWLVVWLRARLGGADNLEVRRADLHRVPLAGAGLVVCYLGPGATERLRPRLEAELPAGAWVATHTFALRGWVPRVETAAGDLYRSPVYLYRV